MRASDNFQESPFGEPLEDPQSHATRQACRKVLAGEPLENWDIEALSAFVFAETMERAELKGDF